MGILKQGRRELNRKKHAEAKLHKKEFYKIMRELERVDKLRVMEKATFTEEGIDEEVKRYSDIKLGSLEKAILLNKQYENIPD